MSEIRRVPEVTRVDSTIDVPLSKVRPVSAEHSTGCPGAGAPRSGPCAATPTTHARITRSTRKDAGFSIMARSVRRPPRRQVNWESEDPVLAKSGKPARGV